LAAGGFVQKKQKALQDTAKTRRVFGLVLLYSDFSQLSEAKQTTTRCAGGKQALIAQKHLSD
jgi:hypothetical protein